MTRLDVSGVRELKVDQKGRVFLPKGIFDTELDRVAGAPLPELYLAPSSDLCLLLIDQAEYRRMQKRLRTMDFGTKRVRKQQRFFFGLVSKAKADKSGRITLTDKQREFSKIDDQVVFCGLSKRIELWSPERYAEQGLDDYSQLTEDSELIQDLDALLSGEGFER